MKTSKRLASDISNLNFQVQLAAEDAKESKNKTVKELYKDLNIVAKELERIVNVIKKEEPFDKELYKDFVDYNGRIEIGKAKNNEK